MDKNTKIIAVIAVAVIVVAAIGVAVLGGGETMTASPRTALSVVR